MIERAASAWYDTLVSDCRVIQEEGRVVVGKQLLEYKWKLGDRIYRDYPKFERYEHGSKTQENLANDLNLKHKQRVSELIEFRRIVGLDFQVWINCPTGRTITWRKVVHQLLPQRREAPTLTEYEVSAIERELNVLHGDFREREKAIPENSVDLILTDPPYGGQYLELWAALGNLAKRVLVDGGYLIAYSGQLYLPQVLNALSQHLEYFWALALRQKSRNLMQTRNIFSLWKPILIFFKPPLNLNEKYLVDIIEGPGAEKNNHQWQQAESEIYPLIEYFCPQNGVILDPMAGSGTTLAAAKKLQRQYLGIELEAENLPKIAERLEWTK